MYILTCECVGNRCVKYGVEFIFNGLMRKEHCCYDNSLPKWLEIRQWLKILLSEGGSEQLHGFLRSLVWSCGLLAVL